MNTEFYDILGVRKAATADEIKKAYRKLAIKNHPDKGGDPEQFKKIAEAYGVLSDPEKRGTYDRFGKDGLQGGPAANFPHANDLFSMFFGGGQQQAARSPQKGKDVVHPLSLSLEELYQGKTLKLSVLHTRIKYPEHRSRHEATVACPACNGRGATTQVRRMGPIVHQSHTACSACGGTGKSLAPFATLVKEKKILDIRIAPGMRDGDQVRFPGESDERPGVEPGDLVFVVREKKHAEFQRSGADLMVTKEIGLTEALCGSVFALRHLDQRDVYVSTENEVLTPGEIRCVENEGMPQDGGGRGKLFVVFTIRFPSALTGKQKKLLRKIWPGPGKAASLAGRHVYRTKKVDKSSF